MNHKLNEFIIKYNNFYNTLSEHNKKIISDLDKYADLSVYRINDLSACIKERAVYIYIGIKDKKYYFAKCMLIWDDKTYNYIIDKNTIKVIVEIYFDKYALIDNYTYTELFRTFNL